MRVNVRCFASVREALGSDRVTVDAPEGTTVAALKAQLAARAPDLLNLRMACAVNREWADGARVLRDGDEVAFIPPISGGGGRGERFRFDLVRGVIDARALEAEVRSDADGALVTFAGVTRDHHAGQAVRGLSYEAYPEMAQQVVDALLEDAARRFSIGRARVAHRLGDVPIGAASVVIVVAAAHREAAFDACRFLIDRLKVEAPIFKQEHLGGGTHGSRWIGDLPEGRPQV